MTKKYIFTFCGILTATFLLTSCMNMFGFVDKPSGDEQLLSAARACLDRQDFVCATEYYSKLSANSNDAKLTEMGILRLQQSGIFSFTDMLTAMGTGRGGKDTFRNYAVIMAANHKIDAATRVIISEVYQSVASVQDIHQKAYVQFLAAYSMFNSVLGAAVNNGQLLITDIVNNATCATNPLCVGQADCGIGLGTGLTNTTTATDMSTTSDWDTASATLGQLVQAADAANTAMNILTNSTSNSGIFATIAQLASINPVAGVPCIRQELIGILF